MRVQWRRAERTRRRVVDAFLPCANAVTPDYWAYAKFRFAQRVASSCITVFATQQMLQAVGLGATRRRAALGGAVVGRNCRGPDSPASDASCDDILGFGAFDEGGSASSQVRGQSAGESSPRPTTAPPDESSSTRPESVSPSTGHPTDGPSPPAPLEPLPTSAGLKRGPRASITTCVAIPIQWSSRGLSAWRSRSGGWSGGHFLLGWSPKGGRG